MMRCVSAFVYVRWQQTCGIGIRSVRNENGGGGSSPGCGVRTEKAMVSRSRRGGVPVLSRPTSKPNSRMQSERCSAASSPARPAGKGFNPTRSEEHTAELQSRLQLVFRLLLEKKKRLNKPV